MKIDALMLCGGAATRMGGLDKGLQHYQGKPLLEHGLAACETWALNRILISANRHLDSYGRYGLAVVPDRRDGFQGPLAGIEAGLMASAADALLVLPCDVLPYPVDLLATLQSALREDVPVVSARDAERSHPVLCLLRRGQLAQISQRLDAGERGVMRWQQAVGGLEVQVASHLYNRNTLDSLQAAD